MEESIKSKSPWVILENGKIKHVDHMDWYLWFQDIRNRVVAQNHVADENGVNFVSTVFLGFNHGLGMKGYRPQYFETMVFGGKHNEIVARYETLKEATEGHAKILEIVEEDSIKTTKELSANESKCKNN